MGALITRSKEAERQLFSHSRAEVLLAVAQRVFFLKKNSCIVVNILSPIYRIMVYTCDDGRECTIGFGHAKPCFLYECSNPCLWNTNDCPKYDIQSESEECPLAFCSKPGPSPTPPPPPPPPPPPAPDSSLVLVDTIIICLFAGIILGTKKVFHFVFIISY